MADNELFDGMTATEYVKKFYEDGYRVSGRNLTWLSIERQASFLKLVRDYFEKSNHHNNHNNDDQFLVQNER